MRPRWRRPHRHAPTGAVEAHQQGFREEATSTLGKKSKKGEDTIRFFLQESVAVRKGLVGVRKADEPASCHSVAVIPWGAARGPSQRGGNGDKNVPT